MKKILLVSSILVCFAFTVSTFAQNGNRVPSGCGSDFSATLVVNSDPGLNISPDGVGPTYLNGGSKNNKVSIGFQIGNCTYDLIVQLGSSTRYLVTNVPTKGIFNAKFANFDRIASVPITTDNLAMADFCGLNANGSYRYDNYGGCGTDAVGSFVKRNVGIDLGDGSHSLRFQYSPIDAPGGNPNAAGTSYIKVYHPNATTWQIAPEFPATGAFLTNSGSPSLQNVPFSFTVTRP